LAALSGARRHFERKSKMRIEIDIRIYEDDFSVGEGAVLLSLPSKISLSTIHRETLVDLMVSAMNAAIEQMEDAVAEMEQ
jgi:hypothetical protein